MNMVMVKSMERDIIQSKVIMDVKARARPRTSEANECTKTCRHARLETGTWLRARNRKPNALASVGRRSAKCATARLATSTGLARLILLLSLLLQFNVPHRCPDCPACELRNGKNFSLAGCKDCTHFTCPQSARRMTL